MSKVKDILTILKYTIKENITKKAFIITTIILMIMIIAICNIPNIIKATVQRTIVKNNLIGLFFKLETRGCFRV